MEAVFKLLQESSKKLIPGFIYMLKNLYNNNKDELYLEFIEEEARQGCRTMTLLAVFLFPAFSVLDYLTQNDNLIPLSYIRFSTSLIFLCAHFLFQKGYGLKRPFITGPILLAIASLSITSMCLLLTGSESPYYAGVNLVVLAGVLLLPSRGFHSALTISIVIGIYVLGILWKEGPVPTFPAAYVNNLYFLFSTGIIGVTASVLQDEVRKEAFFSNLEIKRSMEVLQNELKGEKGDIETLAQGIILKKGEVQSSLELRDQFISMASHELMTPLTALKMKLEIGRRKLVQPVDIDQLKKIIDSADSQIEKVIKVVDEMLDVSRIQSGKFVINKQEFVLNDLMKEILNRYYEQQVSDRKITFQDAEAKIFGNWDPFKIEQVILNLINNAIRYGGTEEIQISLSVEKQFAVLRVKDNGSGIHEADQKKIFEKFERGTSHNIPEGLGLGLYICKEIVDAHGGKIILESSPGKGAVFIVRLPI